MAITYSALSDFTVADVVDIARNGGRLKLLDIRRTYPGEELTRLMRIQQSAAWVSNAMREVEVAAAEGREATAYYGINTGFGDNAGRATFKQISEAEALSRKILLSHTVGVGPYFPEDVVRAALLIRIISLARGYSGVRSEVINLLITMLNKRMYPAVPSQGSLGSSGDLVPLAHLVIPASALLPGEDPSQPGVSGWCFLRGELVSGAEAMHAVGLTPIRLGPKEGVALINGTAFSTAVGVLALYDAQQLLAASEIAVALTAEAMRGFRDAFLPYINRLRSPAQAEAAASILALLEGSTFIRGAADVDLPAHEGPPQDPYSIRCVPAVFGAVRSTLTHVESVLNTELQAATDNPLVFASEMPSDPDHLPRQTKVISGGNFHGEPVGFVMDFLAIAVAELANIAERRVFLLLDPKLNRGLPPFLVNEPPGQTGLNSGLMMAQYTAASLVSENKSLAHPASVDSIPSSANREDHNAMSTIAARKAAQIIGNVQRVTAIELLCAAQAVRLRLEQQPDLRLGRGARRSLEFIYRLELTPGHVFDVIREDTPLTPYLTVLVDAIQSGEMVTYVYGRGWG